MSSQEDPGVISQEEPGGHGGAGRTQGNPGSSKEEPGGTWRNWGRTQEDPGKPRKTHAEGARISQEDQEDPWVQEQPGVARRETQEEPGGPGGARRSHE